jgi:hypothetical protein
MDRVPVQEECSIEASQKGSFLIHPSFSLPAHNLPMWGMHPALMSCTLEDIELSLGLA